MIAPRRFLPSISSLLALEAVERLGTATAAAEELSLTHSAVSRQMKALEEQIGVTLFRREGKGLALTQAGSDYAASVRGYLQDLARASLKIRAGGERQSLNLAVLPAFGTHWLLPRLKAFAADNPEITVNLSTRLRPFDVLREPFDAAIHFGGQDWQGVDYQALTREEMIPAAAVPGLVAPADLLGLPLLHLESRPGAWEDWFARHDTPAERLRGMLFDQFTQMAEAAALGLGVALLPRFLAEAEFARGRLHPLADHYTPVEGAYWLVWPQLRPVSPALARLRAALMASGGAAGR
ncbi:LysR substrate-binding domain-containing protein [Rhodobacter sp. KR11]|uniref:LysR substrate-binding domain-containing protein n=1 Tax=Rhodobacter sp. KR11 TaxID=2974588 RepID=UPI002223E147|nr:LysR substrate-binding domain-containing protein [Rhodobacter sp. KR11]MCW1918151.1 LysR substrate-binding domain-containing protein [Rhodobacter sp. KR11]